MNFKEFLSVVAMAFCLSSYAAPVQEFDIKASLALPQAEQQVMYASLSAQWEASTNEEKETFRLSMRKQLDNLSAMEKLSVIGKIFAAVGRVQSSAANQK